MKFKGARSGTPLHLRYGAQNAGNPHSWASWGPSWLGSDSGAAAAQRSIIDLARGGGASLFLSVLDPSATNPRKRAVVSSLRRYVGDLWGVLKG